MNKDAAGRLGGVYYELFQSDLESLDPSASLHILDREIRLDFDRSSRFITWGSDPIDYCVSVSKKSSFISPAETVVDVSHSPLWRELIGKQVELEFLDDDHQVLRIRGHSGECVYVSSQENGSWGLDVISISLAPPAWPAR